MDLKISKKELLKLCLQDRDHPFKLFNKKMPISKKMNLDLLVKMIYFFINCIGKHFAEKIIFVDEVKNNSMIINMHNTMRICPKRYCIANFREIKRGKHLKLGILYPIIAMLKILICFGVLLLIFPFLGCKKFREYSALCFIGEMQNVHKKMSDIGVDCEFVMTDHNFYSTALCNSLSIHSCILQHGLIQDKYLYQPVLADCFYAWGKRSKELLEKTGKIIVSGTYKFNNLKPVDKHLTKKILFCVSDLNFAEVANKIFDIKSVAVSLGYILNVKLHPGSFFNDSGLEEKFIGVQFFKEEQLSDLSFDIAIIENSTILIDMLYLNKPYIIYANSAGYFYPYETIPLAKNKRELAYLLENISTIDYKTLKDIVLKEELNDGICSIF